MSLRDLIRGSASCKPATAIAATLAKDRAPSPTDAAIIATVARVGAPEPSRQPETVANIATVAVASPPSAGRRIGAAWDADDWQAFYGERAELAEFDGGLPRPEAEARAWEYSIGEWLVHHAVQSDPGRCHWCGSDAKLEALVPYGTTGHAWLHGQCWPAWFDARKARAAAALMAMGLKAATEGSR